MRNGAGKESRGVFHLIVPLTLLLFIGASGAAAVTRFQTVVLAVQVAVQTVVDVQVGVTAEHT